MTNFLTRLQSAQNFFDLTSGNLQQQPATTTAGSNIAAASATANLAAQNADLCLAAS